MTEALDSILSGDGKTTPSPEPVQQTETQPAASTEPAEGQSNEAAEQGTDGQKTVPQAALHAERQKAKRYTEQVASFETRVSELQRQNSGLSNQVSELVQTLQRQQPPQERPDFFSDPDAAMQNALRPVMQHIGAMHENVSKRFAVSEHGSDTVSAAYQAMEQGMQNDPAVRGEYQRIMNSGDQWGELVRWHKRTSALKEIGDDPAAYKERLKTEILAELQPGNGQQAVTSKTAPVMPSNIAGARNVGSRTGPAWGGPTPLADIFDRKRPA